MDGVTILNSYEYLTNDANIVGSILLFIGFLAASIVIFITLLNHRSRGFGMEYVILIALVAITITVGVLIPEKKYETRYQVITDDSVSINQFQNKYEIIEVEGKIYTVKERVK